VTERAFRTHWDRWYARRATPVAMGSMATYKRAAEWLDRPGCLLEDWGGGTGYARRLVQWAAYRVIDGSPSEWTDEVAELAAYRSEADCILLRHVLEHNDEWRAILDNAAASFRWRMAVVLYTEPAEVSHDARPPRGRIPTWRFRLGDLTEGLPLVRLEKVRSETLLYFERVRDG